jgi:PAS domain S-box-containing protein
VLWNRLLARRHRRTVAELQQSTVQVAAIVDCALDAIVAMDQDGRITQWNPAAEETFGWMANQAIGQLVSELIIPERFRLEHEKGLSHYRRTQTGGLLGKVSELSAIRRDGREFPVELAIDVGHHGDDGSATFIGVIRDVSVRHRAERLQGARFVVASVLSDATGVSETAGRILAAIGTRLDFAVAALWSPSLGGLRCQHVWAADPDAVAELLDANRQSTLPAGSGLPGRVWSTGRPHTLAEFTLSHEDFARMAAAGRVGLHDIIAVPVTASSRVLGVLELFSQQPQDVDEELVRTMSDLAGQFGQFMARRLAELREESPQRIAELLESAADSIIVIGDDGGILALNSRARATLGYGTLEILGEDLRSIIVDADRSRLIAYVADTLRQQAGAEPAPAWCEVGAQRRDRSVVPISLHITPVVVGGRNVFLGLISPAATAPRPGYPSAEAAGTTPASAVEPPGEAAQRPKLV